MKIQKYSIIPVGVLLLWLLPVFAYAQEQNDFKVQCLECHQETIEKWEASAYVHPPFKEGKCTACHATEHMEFTSKPGQSCLICHTMTLEKLRQSHFGADVTGKDCTSCHYTHGSERKGLLKEFVHTPFLKGMCNICHKLTTDGKIELKDEPGKLCLSCHKALIDKEGGNVHPALDLMGCIDCHSPHTTSRERLLKKDQTKLCLDCHDPDQIKKHPSDVVPSGKIIKEQNYKVKLSKEGKVVCSSCHNPHSSKEHYLLQESMDQAQLCYSCHRRE
jgi:predicted CXXCH cytochrome family protein